MQVVGRTHHMLLSGWGKGWREVQLIMSNLFTSYLDDSGTDTASKVAIATGLIIPAAKIIALENEWNNLKAKYGFGCFHMSEFAARNPKHEPKFGSWDDKEHSKVFERVRQITKKYGVMVISFAVNKKDYNEVVPDEIKKYAGKFHYSWAVRQFISFIHEWRRERQTGPLEYVFDSMKKKDPRRIEIEDVMDQAETLSGETGEYLNYSFRSRCELPGLQCADMLAWVAYQTAVFAFTRRPLAPDALIGWKDLDKYGNGQWRHSLAITRDKLKKWAHDEQNHTKALASFKRWEEAKLARKGGNVKSRV